MQRTTQPADRPLIEPFFDPRTQDHSAGVPCRTAVMYHEHPRPHPRVVAAEPTHTGTSTAKSVLPASCAKKQAGLGQAYSRAGRTYARRAGSRATGARRRPTSAGRGIATTTARMPPLSWLFPTSRRKGCSHCCSRSGPGPLNEPAHDARPQPSGERKQILTPATGGDCCNARALTSIAWMRSINLCCSSFRSAVGSRPGRRRKDHRDAVPSLRSQLRRRDWRPRTNDHGADHRQREARKDISRRRR